MEKETFIIRTEWYKSISKLGVEEKAILLDNLFNYHNLNNNLINLNNPMVDLVWGLIEPNLRRNIESYDARKQSSVENGKLGGRPKKAAENDENNLNNLNKPNDKTQEPNETLSVSDSVSVSDSDSVSESVIEEINTEASPFFSEIPFSESEDITLEVEEEKRKKVAPKKEKEERAEDFRQSMMPYLETYGSDMMGEFFSYWTETDNRTTKLRFEKQDFFDIAKRLATWHKKQSTAFGKVNPISKTESLLNNTATLLNKYQ